jgi:hypothetical protein
MSQSGIYYTGTPAVGPIDTITGDIGGAIAPDAAFNINVVGGTNITVTGNPATNTLTIDQTGGAEGTGQTIGAVTADLITFALGATPGTYEISARIAGFEATTPAGAGYRINAGVRTTGAAGILLGTFAVDTFEEAGLVPSAASIVVVGNNVIVRVLGTAALTINWAAELDSIFVG